MRVYNARQASQVDGRERCTEIGIEKERAVHLSSASSFSSQLDEISSFFFSNLSQLLINYFFFLMKPKSWILRENRKIWKIKKVSELKN